ncbi:MAG: pyruvoyl-dependent arginine decarboxylase [Janthinobacterium lividum]
MRIFITSAMGNGTTRLAAFDNALFKAGVANFNLIPLSSVIPPGASIQTGTTIRCRDESATGCGADDELGGQWGDRLYVVMAEHRTETMNTEVWAGVGWVQDRCTGKGLFVEHVGGTEQEVRSDIQMTLRNLMETRGVDFGNINMEVVGGACHDLPVCALSIAVFAAQSWA